MIPNLAIKTEQVLQFLSNKIWSVYNAAHFIFSKVIRLREKYRFKYLFTVF
jgi:hypothetical protein